MTLEKFEGELLVELSLTFLLQILSQIILGLKDIFKIARPLLLWVCRAPSWHKKMASNFPLDIYIYPVS